MKRLQYLLAPAMLLFLVLSCSKDTESIGENYDLTLQIANTAQLQEPNAAYDSSERGIYHGLIASATTQARGKVWVNVGNNGYFNAYIDMVGGEIYNLQLDVNSISEDTGDATYIFTSTQGRFQLNLNNINQPQITDAVFNNHNYAMNVVKSRSYSRASSVTATFQASDGQAGFEGTWGLISDGVVSDPNGSGGEAISSVVITMDGSVYTDNEFDEFNATSCFGIPDFIPTINTSGVVGHIISAYQTSSFADGTAKWGIGYDPVNIQYADYHLCAPATAGYVQWTNDEGTLTRIGEINVD